MKDLINRQEAIEALIQLHAETGVKTAQAIRVIRELPPADPKEEDDK